MKLFEEEIPGVTSLYPGTGDDVFWQEMAFVTRNHQKAHEDRLLSESCCGIHWEKK